MMRRSDPPAFTFLHILPLPQAAANWVEVLSAGGPLLATKLVGQAAVGAGLRTPCFGGKPLNRWYAARWGTPGAMALPTS